MSFNNDRDLASIVATLTELTKAVEAIRGGENAAPALDPSDPLNELMRGEDVATDATDNENEFASERIQASGEPRTIRNFLTALMKREGADRWYTVRSNLTRRKYRVSLLTARYSATDPSGTARSFARAHDFDLPVSLNEVAAGWIVDDTAKVLDVFSLGSETYAIYEMLG